MSDSEKLAAISGQDVIMAYGYEPKYYPQHYKHKSLCTCFFWSRYFLFVLNFLIWATGATIIALGSWTQVNGVGLHLFESLLTVPSWMLIGTGIVMFALGVFGCAAALRLSLCCLRTFMVLVAAVFALQVAMAVILYFLMDDVELQMFGMAESAVIHYQTGDDLARDKSLEYLQREFSCCGGSNQSDWEANVQYNCSSFTSAARCGVPSSCCRGAPNEGCGYGTRDGTEEYSDMFIYTNGCVVILMRIVKENIIIVAALASVVCFLEICSFAVAHILCKQVIRSRKLEL